MRFPLPLPLLLLAATLLRAETMPVTSIYDQTPPGFPSYTDIDLAGGRCGGYRDDWPCFQWVPLPSSYVQDLPIYAPPIVPPYQPPVSPVPEPAAWPLLWLVTGFVVCKWRKGCA
jgi:hypothetical protein